MNKYRVNTDFCSKKYIDVDETTPRKAVKKCLLEYPNYVGKLSDFSLLSQYDEKRNPYKMYNIECMDLGSYPYRVVRFYLCDKKGIQKKNA